MTAKIQNLKLSGKTFLKTVKVSTAPSVKTSLNRIFESDGIGGPAKVLI